MKTNEITLSYSVSGLCEVERRLGRKLHDVLTEVTSEAGAGLRTLVALLAAGAKHPASMPAESWFDEIAAQGLIQRHGLAKCALAVGASLDTFLRGIQ